MFHDCETCLQTKIGYRHVTTFDQLFQKLMKISFKTLQPNHQKREFKTYGAGSPQNLGQNKGTVKLKHRSITELDFKMVNLR